MIHPPPTAVGMPERANFHTTPCLSLARFGLFWDANFHDFGGKTPQISLSELESLKNQVSRPLASFGKAARRRADVGQTSGTSAG